MHSDVSNVETHLYLSKKHMYFTKKNIINTAVFANTSPRDKFLNISSFLHFTDKVKEIKNDKIRKIRNIADYLNDIFFVFVLQIAKCH